ncbi:MAG TPA: molybdopterin molybdotransferase MoeA [Thiobacillaceae bacterium]|nr:molybdopterin molybdotransferase MoeA [Thiobacillaceae bacterium]HNU64559.1 molybdopterin molybdotransferase MoeA [Thiobacillaceae bacterium]
MSDMLSFDDALQRLMQAARPLVEIESVPADAALGRVLAEPVVSGVHVPPLDNAAMDGYALLAADWQAGACLPVSQRIPAGSLGDPLQAGTVARIFTGAPLPLGADAVVMQEDTETGAGGIRINRPPRPGDHVRHRGEDIRAGQAVLAQGTRLGPAQLGVAAAVGSTRLPVYRRLRVAVFFTGDELIPPGEPLPLGRIYNSNRATLLALLTRLGVQILDLGQVPDRAEATVSTLEQAAREADVVITTGGVSVGEEDHVRAAVQRLGRLDLWKVAMKPGKPLAYGQVGDADFLGLPGNPVSAFVVYTLFARPFLLARMGAPTSPPLSFQVPADFTWPRPGSRREFLRARLEAGGVTLYANQSSGVLTSLAWADGLVDIPIGTTVRPGDTVRFLPLGEWLQ